MVNAHKDAALLARHYLSPPAAGPGFDAEGFVPMTEDRLRKLLGPFYPADPDDAEAMLKQANADPHEGKEWLPRYKAALSLLAMECGYLAGVIDKIRFVASEKGYREELQRRLDVAGEYWQAHLRLVADELPTDPAPNEEPTKETAVYDTPPIETQAAGPALYLLSAKWVDGDGCSQETFWPTGQTGIGILNPAVANVVVLCGIYEPWGPPNVWAVHVTIDAIDYPVTLSEGRWTCSIPVGVFTEDSMSTIGLSGSCSGRAVPPIEPHTITFGQAGQ